MKKFSFLAVMVFMLFGVAGIGQAKDFATALEITLSEIPDGGDIAAMGNPAVRRDFSTKNPAVTGASIVSKNVVVCANYGLFAFKNGFDMSLYSVSAMTKLPLGITRLTVTEGNSTTGGIDEIGDIKLNGLTSIELQYGLPLSDDLYGGIVYTHNRSKLTIDTMFFDETVGVPFDVELASETRSHEIGVGLLYRLGEKVDLGFFYNRASSRSRDYVNDIKEGTARSATDQLRAGFSAQLALGTVLAAEYRHFWFEEERDAQYFAGIEQYLNKIVALYCGYANGGATAGLGIYLKNGGLNLAYMHRPFRSTEDFLGEAKVFEALLFWNF